MRDARDCRRLSADCRLPRHCRLLRTHHREDREAGGRGRIGFHESEECNCRLLLAGLLGSRARRSPWRKATDSIRVPRTRVDCRRYSPRKMLASGDAARSSSKTVDSPRSFLLADGRAYKAPVGRVPRPRRPPVCYARPTGPFLPAAEQK